MVLIALVGCAESAADDGEAATGDAGESSTSGAQDWDACLSLSEGCDAPAGDCILSPGGGVDPDGACYGYGLIDIIHVSATCGDGIDFRVDTFLPIDASSFPAEYPYYALRIQGATEEIYASYQAEWDGASFQFSVADGSHISVENDSFTIVDGSAIFHVSAQSLAGLGLADSAPAMSSSGDVSFSTRARILSEMFLFIDDDRNELALPCQ